MESQLLLDVALRQRTAVFKLLSRKDQTLLVGKDALFILDLGLDIVDCVGRFDFKSNGSFRLATAHYDMGEKGYTQCCQLSARIPRESGIDRRKIDRRVIFKGLGKQSKIDVPLDRDRRTLGFPRDPFSCD